MEGPSSHLQLKVSPWEWAGGSCKVLPAPTQGGIMSVCGFWHIRDLLNIEIVFAPCTICLFFPLSSLALLVLSLSSLLDHSLKYLESSRCPCLFRVVMIGGVRVKADGKFCG